MEKSGLPQASFSMSWSSLSIALAILAVGSLSTLVVVVSVNEVDVLSSVALALAIIAFGAQIVVTLAQVQTANQQLVSTERVNSETRGLLAKITSQSEALLTNQTQQFDRVLDAALAPEAVRHAVSVASGDEGEDGFPVDVDAGAITRVLRSSAQKSLNAGPIPEANPHQWFIDEMSEWPAKDEAQQALDVFRSLTAVEAALLVRRAKSDIRRAGYGLNPVGFARKPLKASRANEGLIEKGLVEYVDGNVEHHDEVLERRLTALGRTVARMLNVGELPDRPEWLESLIGD